MEVAIKTTNKINEKIAMDTLFSYLDKGIDDMEAGRMHTGACVGTQAVIAVIIKNY